MNETSVPKLLDFDKIDKIVNDPNRPAQQLHNISVEILATAKKDIVFANASFTIQNNPLIYRNSITALQGQAGSYKSKALEMLIASAIAENPNQIRGIVRHTEKRPVVILLDTERSLSDSLPYAVQRIKTNAGYKLTDDIEKFYVTSTVKIPRPDRMQVFQEYIAEIRDIHPDDDFLICVDVFSDLGIDFNNVADSMQVLDYLNFLVNDFDCSVACVLHENPNPNSSLAKMRGSAGTELMNKASVVYQLVYNFADDLIAMNNLKMRNQKRAKSIPLTFDEETKGLIVVDEETAIQIFDNKMVDFADSVQKLLSNRNMTQKDFLSELVKLHQVSKNTALARINEIIKNPNKFGYQLQSIKDGRAKVYSINQIASYE